MVAVEKLPKVVNVSKLENTRVKIDSEYEAFKQKRAEEFKKINREIAAPVAESTKSAEPTIEIPTNTIAEEVAQSELSLNEPPEVIVQTAPVNDWAHGVSKTELLALWQEFIETQTLRMKGLMRDLEPTINGTEVEVTVPPKKIEAMESVRFPFNRFIIDKTDGKLNNLKVLSGELSQTDRRPYTDKEKLEFLVKNHPELEDVIKKLGLRLP